MNFEPVCASVLWIGIVFVSSGILLWLLYRADEDFVKVQAGKIRGYWIIFSLAAGLFWLLRSEQETAVAGILYGVLAVYLILCSVMDAALQQVCDCFQYLGVAGGVLYLMYNAPAPHGLGELLVYVGIQWMVFRKMYGPADVAAYVICGMYLIAEEKSLTECLIHMAVTFGILGVIQGIKRNISSKGNLKNPVALLPYITVAFFLII